MRAMILAAGRGERMRPLTDNCPKPLLPVGGKPLIVWHIEHLARAGISDIVINHAHKGKMLEEALGNGHQWDVSIEYSPEGEALETAGGIANALPLLGDAPFLVVNGDIYCDLDFARFVARGLLRMTQGAQAYLSMVDNPAHHPEGDFALDDDNRLHPAGDAKLTFSGIGMYRPELFKDVSPGTKARLAPLLIAAMQSGRVRAEHFTGLWTDVGTPERLYEIDALLKSQSVELE